MTDQSTRIQEAIGEALRVLQEAGLESTLLSVVERGPNEELETIAHVRCGIFLPPDVKHEVAEVRLMQSVANAVVENFSIELFTLALHNAFQSKMQLLREEEENG